MGLDSFWVSEDSEEAKLIGLRGDKYYGIGGRVIETEEEYNLCGGMFSSNGNGSFRGKVYNPLVEHVTDVSLYQENIPNDVVKQMAEALSKWEQHGDEYMLNTINQIYRPNYFDEDNVVSEFKNLVRMFNDYAKRGASLSGWW